MHSLFNYALFVFISLLISYEKHLLLWNEGICSVAALLRTSLGLRQQYKSRRAKANAALSCGACFCIALCGGGGIRTPGTLPFIINHFHTWPKNWSQICNISRCVIQIYDYFLDKFYEFRLISTLFCRILGLFEPVLWFFRFVPTCFAGKLV